MSLRVIQHELGLTVKMFHEQAYARAYGEVRYDRVDYDVEVHINCPTLNGKVWLPNQYQKDYYRYCIAKIKERK